MSESNHEADDVDPEEPTFERPLWHRQELDRRWAQAEVNPDDVKTWEEVKAEILRRHRSRDES